LVFFRRHARSPLHSSCLRSRSSPSLRTVFFGERAHFGARREQDQPRASPPQRELRVDGHAPGVHRILIRRSLKPRRCFWNARQIQWNRPRWSGESQDRARVVILPSPRRNRSATRSGIAAPNPNSSIAYPSVVAQSSRAVETQCGQASSFSLFSD